MNFTILSLCLAAAQPLMQSYFTNYMRRKMVKDAQAAYFVLVHKLNGRRRYRSELLKDEFFANELASKIEALGLNLKIKINSITGTILFEYECEDEQIENIINHLNEQNDKVNNDNLNRFDNENQSIFTKAVNFIKGNNVASNNSVNSNENSVESGKLTVNAYNRRRKPTIVSQALFDYMTGLNNIVKALFKNAVDLSVIAGSIFLGWGAYKILTNNERPNGPQLAWWGYQVLKGGVR